MEKFNEDFVKTIDFKKHLYSPILFDGKEMKSIRCDKGFWVSPSFGEFLKDDKGNMKVFGLEDIKTKRAEYIFKFPDSIKEPEKPKSNDPEFGKPMFTAHFDNPKEMEILKKVFHKDALEAVDFNMDKVAENLEKEKKRVYGNS